VCVCTRAGVSSLSLRCHLTDITRMFVLRDQKLKIVNDGGLLVGPTDLRRINIGVLIVEHPVHHIPSAWIKSNKP